MAKQHDAGLPLREPLARRRRAKLGRTCSAPSILLRAVVLARPPRTNDGLREVLFFAGRSEGVAGGRLLRALVDIWKLGEVYLVGRPDPPYKWTWLPAARAYGVSEASRTPCR